jgi:hypothetical protein
MPSYGFGHEPFGNSLFGNANWCKIVLWDELPDSMKVDDEGQGFPYKKFVNALCPSYNYLVRYIRNLKDITDYVNVRHDLLQYLGKNFGIEVDLAEPESYQRMRVGLAARWNIIKGTEDAYVTLCRVHGFECELKPLWWTGYEYVDTEPELIKVPSYTSEVSAPNTSFVMRLDCYPIEPGTIKLNFDDGASGYTLTDDSLGELVGAKVVSSSIDYGWGYLTFTISSTTDTFVDAEYTSVAGGCVDSCLQCKTHRLKIVITPGDIAGQSELTITDAFERLFKKLGAYGKGTGVIPVHVELGFVEHDDVEYLSIGYRYDGMAAEETVTDRGLIWTGGY